MAAALWVELYGPDMLARVRSAVEAALVVASGAAPVLMGYLIDWGAPLSDQALGCLAYIVLASLLAAVFEAVRKAGHEIVQVSAPALRAGGLLPDRLRDAAEKASVPWLEAGKLQPSARFALFSSERQSRPRA